MNTFRYFMPVDTYFGRDCIAEHKDVMKKLGQKALIVTGRTSAKKNGSQQDVTDALEALGMQWVLFDEIGENPDFYPPEEVLSKTEVFITLPDEINELQDNLWRQLKK